MANVTEAYEHAAWRYLHAVRDDVVYGYGSPSVQKSISELGYARIYFRTGPPSHQRISVVPRRT